MFGVRSAPYEGGWTGGVNACAMATRPAATMKDFMVAGVGGGGTWKSGDYVGDWRLTDGSCSEGQWW